MEINNILIVLGTLWPLPGVCLAIYVAFLLPGRKRWLMLFAGPALVILPCVIFAEQLAYNGNMLFVALMAIVLIFFIFYYPTLIFIGVMYLIKARNEPRGS